MPAIREEARAIAQGRMDKENNSLKNAPHTVEDLLGEWNRPYSREAACFPAGTFRVDKYWPPVNRVDNVYGARTSFAPAHRWKPRSRRRNKVIAAGRGRADGATELTSAFPMFDPPRARSNPFEGLCHMWTSDNRGRSLIRR